MLLCKTHRLGLQSGELAWSTHGPGLDPWPNEKIVRQRGERKRERERGEGGRMDREADKMPRAAELGQGKQLAA